MAGTTTNKIIVIGNLGANPEIRFTQTGTAVGNVNIATNEGYFNKENQWVEQTEWHKGVVWDERLVEKLKGLKKGDKVYVEGKISTRKWQDQDGQTRYTTEIKVRELYGILEPKDKASVDEEQPTLEDLAPPEEVSTPETTKEKKTTVTKDDSVPF
jgi:single-strand DNA-binding protein